MATLIANLLNSRHKPSRAQAKTFMTARLATGYSDPIGTRVAWTRHERSHARQLQVQHEEQQQRPEAPWAAALGKNPGEGGACAGFELATLDGQGRATPEARGKDSDAPRRKDSDVGSLALMGPVYMDEEDESLCSAAPRKKRARDRRGYWYGLVKVVGGMLGGGAKGASERATENATQGRTSEQEECYWRELSEGWEHAFDRAGRVQ